MTWLDLVAEKKRFELFQRRFFDHFLPWHPYIESTTVLSDNMASAPINSLDFFLEPVLQYLVAPQYKKMGLPNPGISAPQASKLGWG